MSSAQTVVGVMTYMTKSTAATSVSFTGNLKKDQNATGFDDIINNIANSKNNQSQEAKIQGSKDVKQDTLDKVKQTNDKFKASEQVKTNDKKPVKTKETDGKEADKELQNAIEEDGKKLIEEIAEMSDVSEDEILAVMQMLGMTAGDLLNPENIIQVVNVLNESEEGVNLIIDDEMYSSLKDILGEADELTSELSGQFNITAEDIKNAINNKEPKEVEDSLAEIATPKDDIKTDEKLLQTKQEPTVVIEKESIFEESSFTTQETQSETQNSNHKNSDSNLFGKENQINIFNQMVNNILDAAEAVNGTETFTYADRARMEDIVRQITDKITVMTSAEETSMELQLHPASLGNVNILLTSSKDGITAKFTAQNEIVKEAVESQMTALMQKFDEQGVKVTSVEVTIASHAFEQNLQQEDNGEASRDQMEKNKKSLRRINLAEIDEEIEEEMTQAEMIAAQMMAYNGNMVDFSA